MKKTVVLFNLETNKYLNKFGGVSKEWRESLFFDGEGSALACLSEEYKILKDKNLINWCTRTFYSLVEN